MRSLPSTQPGVLWETQQRFRSQDSLKVSATNTGQTAERIAQLEPYHGEADRPLVEGGRRTAGWVA